MGYSSRYKVFQYLFTLILSNYCLHSDAVPDFAKAVYTLEMAENAKPGDTVFTLVAGEGPFRYMLLSKLMPV